MDANLVLGSITAGIAVTFGVWGLVLYRKNGHGPEPSVSQEVKRDPWQVDKLAEVIQPLAALSGKLEQTFRQLAEAQAREPEAPPEWSARMLEDLEHIHEQLREPRPEQAQLAKVAISLDRLTDRLEAFVQLPPPPAPEIPRVNDLIGQIEALVDMERKRASKPSPPAVEKNNPVAAPPRALIETPPSIEPPQLAKRQPGPPVRAANPVNLEIFNTVTVPQDTIVELIPPEPGVFSVSVMNMGPGTVFMNANANPAIEDPHSTTLPPGTGDNGIRMPDRLYAIADVGGAVMSVRLNL